MADPRLLIVTGKGGVGKTTVTAAIGRATSRAGLRTLLVETASPGRLANVLRVPALEAEPRRVDERLDAVSLDADAALASFVATLLPLRMLSNALMGSDTFRIVAAAVPGIAEAALLSQVLAWLEPRGLRRAAWDRIVLDAPATGHSAPLLSTPDTLGGIASVGPLATSLRRMSEWLRDPARTTALVVAIPEAWAVAEAIELWHELRDRVRVPLAPPVANAVFPRRFAPADRERMLAAREAGTVDDSLLAAGLYFARRREDERGHLRELSRATGERPVELPFVFDPEVRLDRLDPVAEALSEVVA
ncbi:MAG: ArsA family ATPase [Alphaproteobacteria bacterium]